MEICLTSKQRIFRPPKVSKTVRDYSETILLELSDIASELSKSKFLIVNITNCVPFEQAKKMAAPTKQ